MALSQLPNWLKIDNGRFSRPLLVSLAVTGLVVATRHLDRLRLLQPVELAVYDRMVRLQPDSDPDLRLLVVGITEKDIQTQQRFPISDRTIAQLLATLQQYQPAAIGLDLYRDIPQQPGTTELLSQLQTPNTIVITKIGTDGDAGIPPPPGIAPEQVGFNDVVLDPDGVVRRNLLLAESEGQVLYSFALRLALLYLAEVGIYAQGSQNNPEVLQLGQTVFTPISARTGEFTTQASPGGYQSLDAQGHQILLQYRSRERAARLVTLNDVLTEQVNPDWIRGRVVLIGTTAESGKDFFPTPYGAANPKPGVVIQAHMVSQILSAVLDHQSLPWYWPEWAEDCWVLGWSLLGAGLATLWRHPGQLGLAGFLGTGGILGISFSLFTQAGWIPPAAPTLAFVMSGVGTTAYIAYRTQQLKSVDLQLTHKQEEPTRLGSTASTAPTEMPAEFQASSPEFSWRDRRKRDFSGFQGLLQGRYRVLDVLGSGGFSMTYLAKDTQRPGEPYCVLKHLRLERHNQGNLNVALRLFNEEAKILELLGENDQIPRLLAYFEEDAEFFLVEELIEGQPLSQELQPDTPHSEAYTVALLRDILGILHFIHQHEVIHRDIKPSNIIRRTSDGRLVLIDFGSVKQLDRDQKRETVMIGTPGYASPEQFNRRPRLNSDIHALGMIGIQALTGLEPTKLPQDDRTGVVMWRHLANGSEILMNILDRMACPDWTKRYQTVKEVLEDIGQLVDSG